MNRARRRLTSVIEPITMSERRIPYTLMPTAVPAADTVLSKWWYLLAVVQSAAVLLHPDTFSSEQILPFGFAELYCCAVPVIEHRVCRPVSVLCHGTI